mmetsp:Transcript_119891/g.339303  ORF Transcript_119891/g.339303 Transcript_119891/m.339303 type:complete len:200 (-) Transcript_119891:476-1075(-)
MILSSGGADSVTDTKSSRAFFISFFAAILVCLWNKGLPSVITTTVRSPSSPLPSALINSVLAKFKARSVCVVPPVGSADWMAWITSAVLVPNWVAQRILQSFSMSVSRLMRLSPEHCKIVDHRQDPPKTRTAKFESSKAFANFTAWSFMAWKPLSPMLSLLSRSSTTFFLRSHRNTSEFFSQACALQGLTSCRSGLRVG